MRYGHYSRKKANSGGGGGGLRIWNFRWLIKNEVEFPRVKQKMENSSGSFKKVCPQSPSPLLFPVCGFFLEYLIAG